MPPVQQHADEVVDALFQGDEGRAAAALRNLTTIDPAQVATDVLHYMETQRALGEFAHANRDITGDQHLAAVADMHLAQATGGRRLEDLPPDGVRAALAQAGESTRRWLRSVAPQDAPVSGEANPSAVIQAMKRARGQR
jgi:hypothetical protein